VSPTTPFLTLSLSPPPSSLPSYIGVFLGYPEKDKHRVWVQCRREDILAAESSAGDYNQLANALLDVVFKDLTNTAVLQVKERSYSMKKR
jgi:hypothetical protein